ncbi:hypothetical protein ACHAXR_010506 [Thalassiosira sp. AJA248-18]
MAAPLRKIPSYYCGGSRSIRSTNIAARTAIITHERARHQRQHRFYRCIVSLPRSSQFGSSFFRGIDNNGGVMENGMNTEEGGGCCSRYYFSSMSSSDYADAAPTPASSPSKSFKKVIRPFLMACHPDVMSMNNTNNDEMTTTKTPRPLSHQAKATNLKAVQTINGLVDVLDDLIGRCTPPSYSAFHTKKSASSLPELNARYEIEFILPTSSEVLETDKPIKRKHRDKVALTLRSITVAFPEHLRSNVRKWALTSFPPSDATSSSYSPREEESFQIAMQLKDHAMSEFLRMLKIAGMQAPAGSVATTASNERIMQPGEQQRKEENRWTLSDHFLYELGIDPMEDAAAAQSAQPSSSSSSQSAFFGRTLSQPSREARTAPPTYSHLKEEREAFMKSIPWDKFEKDYDQSFLDAQANWTTNRLNLYNINTLEGRERREKFVSQICGSVRIWRAKLDDADHNNKDDHDAVDEIPEGLDVVAQLIAIRRLSLILYDNFDHLNMEKMGRMWEQLVIVFKPPRGGGDNTRKGGPKLRDDGTPIIHPGRKLNKWERRKRQREKLKPVSRGRMRHVAESYLGSMGDTVIDDDDNDDSEEGSNQDSSLRHLNESGFKFSYGTTSDQGTGHVTAYIPIDFRDGELVRQLYTHLYDYFDNCCGNIGFLQYGADGELRASYAGDANRGRGGGDADKKSSDRREKKMGAEE